MAELALKCACGQMRGVARGASPEHGNHVICYCDDCQSFAHHLEQRDTLDEQGGTRVYQTYQARVELLEGLEHLKCVRLSPKGLARWYAGCCRTPLGNTMPSAGWPFAGLVGSFIAMDDDALERAVGPVVARVHGRFARGGVPSGAHPSAPVGVIARMVAFLAKGRLTGQHRPSPFFDDAGRFVVEPEVLSLQRRKELLEEVRGG